ncbi:MAG: cohesin domain-containing protein [Candidatus Bathyarchaeia archaeon]
MKNCVIVMLFVASLFAALPIQMAKAQTVTVSVTPQTNTVLVHQTFTVKIEVSNVQNLYAIDFTLDYNSAVIQLTTAHPDLGTDAIAGGGVLYGSPITTDINSLQSGGLYYNTSLSTSSEYRLFATSAGTAQPFSGSGTLATLTFTVIGTGQSPLTLSSTLTDHPQSGETSNPITHNDLSGTVNASTNSSSSPTSVSSSGTPSTSPTSSPSSSSPTATSSVPEVSALVLVLVFLITLVAAVLSVRARRSRGTGFPNYF